jgi:hypothetical protein
MAIITDPDNLDRFQVLVENLVVSKSLGEKY